MEAGQVFAAAGCVLSATGLLVTIVLTARASARREGEIKAQLKDVRETDIRGINGRIDGLADSVEDIRKVCAHRGERIASVEQANSDQTNRLDRLERQVNGGQ